jgi:hypothetical protein
MVRTRVSNKEIAHLWINRAGQPYAQSNSQHFDCNKFYSYGTQIGYLITNDKGDRAVIIDRTKYSVTTSSHQSALLFACNHLTTFKYEKDKDLRKSPEEITADSLYNYYQRLAAELQLKAQRARKNKLYLIEESRDNLRKCNQVIDFFEASHLERIDETHLDTLIQELTVKEIEAQKIREEKELAKLASRLEQDKEDFHAWLDNKIRNFPSSYNSKGIFLRVKERDMVETSRGATFPLDSCQTLYRLYKRSIKEDKAYIEPFKVGNYNVEHISKKGIKAGCHHIQPDEIERFASSIGLKY